MKCDVAILGGGSVANHLIRNFESQSREVLSVSNHHVDGTKRSFSYQDFFSKWPIHSESEIIILSRFDRLPGSILQELLSQLPGALSETLFRITYISSASVYPSVEKKLAEDQSSPESLYGEVKLRTEKILKDVAGENLTILRASNLYGAPGISNLESNILKATESGMPLNLPEQKHMKRNIFPSENVYCVTV